LKQDLLEHKLDFLERVSPRASFSLGSWKGHGKFAFCIGRTSFRVELYFSKDPDKELFDAMLKHKDELESTFDGEIIWERLDNKKASRIKHEMPKSIQDKLEGRFNDEKYWDDLIEWYREAMKKFYKSAYPVWEQVQKEIS